MVTVPHYTAVWLAAAVVMTTVAAHHGHAQDSSGKTSVLEFEAERLRPRSSRPVSLNDYRGKVLLLINTASACGLTPQLGTLQQMYDKYRGSGLEVLAFPSNSFNQEPLNGMDIVSFLDDEYGVTFPVFARISVKGDDQHPLYRYLTSGQANPDLAGPIQWNYEKFLVGRDGSVVARFDPKTTPDSPEVIEAIERAIADR